MSWDSAHTSCIRCCVCTMMTEDWLLPHCDEVLSISHYSSSLPLKPPSRHCCRSCLSENHIKSCCAAAACEIIHCTRVLCLYTLFFTECARARCFWATTDALCRIVFLPTRKWVTRSIHTTQSRITIKLPARKISLVFFRQKLGRYADSLTDFPIFVKQFWPISIQTEPSATPTDHDDAIQNGNNKKEKEQQQHWQHWRDYGNFALLLWFFNESTVACLHTRKLHTNGELMILHFSSLQQTLTLFSVCPSTFDDSLWSFEYLCIEENFFMTSQIVIGIIAWDCSLAAPSCTVEMCVQRSFSWAWVY